MGNYCELPSKRQEVDRGSHQTAVKRWTNQLGCLQVWWTESWTIMWPCDVWLIPCWDHWFVKHLPLADIFKLLTRIPAHCRLKPLLQCFFFQKSHSAAHLLARVTRPSHQRWLSKPATFLLSPPWSSALSLRCRGSVSCSCSRKPDNDLSPVFRAADCLQPDTFSFVCLLRLSASHVVHFFQWNAQWSEMLRYFRVALTLHFCSSRSIVIHRGGCNHGVLGSWSAP